MELETNSNINSPPKKTKSTHHGFSDTIVILKQINSKLNQSNPTFKKNMILRKPVTPKKNPPK